MQCWLKSDEAKQNRHTVTWLTCEVKLEKWCDCWHCQTAAIGWNSQNCYKKQTWCESACCRRETIEHSFLASFWSLQFSFTNNSKGMWLLAQCKVTFSSFCFWFVGQQRRKQLPASVKRNGGKTWSSLVKKKARMTDEKVGNVHLVTQMSHNKTIATCCRSGLNWCQQDGRKQGDWTWSHQWCAQVNATPTTFCDLMRIDWLWNIGMSFKPHHHPKNMLMKMENFKSIHACTGLLGNWLVRCWS